MRSYGICHSPPGLLHLALNCPIPASIKEVCVHSFYFLCNPRDFPNLLSPASLIHHQWISCNLLRYPPLTPLMYKINGKTANFWSIFSICWDFIPGNCCQFGSNKLIKKSLQVLTFMLTTLWVNRVSCVYDLFFFNHIEIFLRGLFCKSFYECSDVKWKECMWIYMYGCTYVHIYICIWLSG